MHITVNTHIYSNIYIYMYVYIYMYKYKYQYKYKYMCVYREREKEKERQRERRGKRDQNEVDREVGGWGRDPKKCTGRDWGMGSSTI